MSAQSSVVPAQRRSSAPSLTLDSMVIRFALGAVGVLLAFGVWELMVVGGILPEIDIPRATTVIGELAHQIQTKLFWNAVWNTARDALTGLGIGALVGVPLGILMGAREVPRKSLRPTTEFMRVVPSLAFVPVVALLWGQEAKVSYVLVGYATLWPFLVQTMHGVQNVDSQAILTARSFRIRGLRLVRWVYLPGALPYVFTAFRICVALALAITVATEVIIGPPGLGTEIQLAKNYSQLPELYSFVFASGVIGLLAVMAVDRIDRLVVRWPHKGAK